MSLHEVKKYDAYDGAPFASETTNGDVQFLDMSVPVYHLEKYDWTMSLEVVEHIPAQFESSFLDNLVRHAREGVILSWAKPGQDGFSHVNGRTFEYARQKLEERGLRHNASLSKAIQDASTLWWLKANTNVYTWN